MAYGRLVWYMTYYLFITFLVMSVSIYLPFLLGGYGYDSAVSGVVTSVFFLAMMAPGLFINRIISLLGRNVLVWALLLIGLGLLGIYINASLAYIILGCIAAGFGYGIAQPYIYDSASSLAPPSKVSVALALVMVMNYVAVVISPFVTDGLQAIVGVKGNHSPFLINALLSFAFMIIVFAVTKIGNKNE
jgi:MFS family permease